MIEIALVTPGRHPRAGCFLPPFLSYWLSSGLICPWSEHCLTSAMIYHILANEYVDALAAVSYLHGGRSPLAVC